MMRVRFEKYEVTKKSVNRQNLNEFTNDTNLNYLDITF